MLHHDLYGAMTGDALDELKRNTGGQRKRPHVNGDFLAGVAQRLKLGLGGQIASHHGVNVLPSPQYTAAFLQPVEVGGRHGFKPTINTALAGWTNSISYGPAVAFHMAVGEGQISRAIVVGGREITPPGLVKAVHEETIVDRVGVFIQKDEGVRGATEVTGLKELDICWIELVSEDTRVAN
jgi:hypothetical protein